MAKLAQVHETLKLTGKEAIMPQQTFKMLEKKYGAKVAAKYKPKKAKTEVPAKATSPANGKNGAKDMV